MESWMVEAAVEELRVLEAEHPNRFDYLKTELKAIISPPPFQHVSPSPPPSPTAASYYYVDTQASSNDGSNAKKRKASPGFQRKVEPRKLWKAKRGGCGYKDSADLALEKAEECLRKIRRLKESLAIDC